ncbi:hypothetical protein D3C84_705470 [compost metagenome]
MLPGLAVRSSISRAASTSARPLNSVHSTSTIRPLRCSIIVCAMCARRLASPLLLRASRASGSVVDWWVALLRFSPLKSASGLRVPSSGGSPPSFLMKDLCEAQASISVPSTLKCSSLAYSDHSSSDLMR